MTGDPAVRLWVYVVAIPGQLISRKPSHPTRLLPGDSFSHTVFTVTVKGGSDKQFIHEMCLWLPDQETLCGR